MNVDQHWYRSKMTFLTYLLLPFSFLFRIIISIRKAFFRLGLKKSYRFSAPIIIVGNITVGGTGKTPLVIWLANLLRLRGYKPGIISKGYRGKLSDTIAAVLPNADPYEVGDEVVLLAKHTDCPVVVGQDRVAAVKFLLAN